MKFPKLHVKINKVNKFPNTFLMTVHYYYFIDQFLSTFCVPSSVLCKIVSSRVVHNNMITFNSLKLMKATEQNLKFCPYAKMESVCMRAKIKFRILLEIFHFI